MSETPKRSPSAQVDSPQVDVDTGGRMSRAEKTKRWQRAHPEKVKEMRWNRTLKSHGVRPEDYDRWFRLQGGKCFICGDPPGKKKLAVDHNHTNGALRKLLCARCNVGLGMFRDNPATLRAAAGYLEKCATTRPRERKERRNGQDENV